ncbi:hypothetical protein [Nocardioides bruguierae]|uniref:Uncharacterized protein n=1 Tax=Nocardioides bruguierae TaxID=2945102 RepID=A0A9X2D6L6_9ACTN|nr:hypothetical protein [Nocardioides bruguierae]MCM0620133.1 hypothetical protein [Nocardioides bruguierae]
MSAALILQTTPWRENADDTALAVVAREVGGIDGIDVAAATADPQRTARVTGVPTVPADLPHLLRSAGHTDTLVVLGGRPLAGRRESLLSLRSLSTLSQAYRAAGRRVAFVDLGVGKLSPRREGTARRLLAGSSLTVLDSAESAARLAAAGLPTPIRVGAHLGWHDLQDLPVRTEGPATFGALVVVDDATLVGGGGPAVLADRIALDLHRAAAGGLLPERLAVQARRPGSAAGADLDAAQSLALGLRAKGLSAAVLPPSPSLRAQRDLLAASARVFAADAETLLAAAAARTPVTPWPTGQRAGGLLAHLGDRGLSAVREQVAAAGEVLDLLVLLLSEGAGTSGHPSHNSALQASRLRPTGVTR